MIVELLDEMLILIRQNRCVLCSWPLAEDGKGCSPGYCSYIPAPTEFKKRERVEALSAFGRLIFEARIAHDRST